MTEAYTLDEIHDEIAEHYRFFAKERPGVWPQETGRLGALWRLHDILVEEGQWTTDQTS